MNPSSIIKVPESEQIQPVSWDAVRTDPVARLNLLKIVRTVPGAEKMISALYDLLRAIAVSSSVGQEALKEKLGDMLTALGLKLDIEVEALAPPEAVPIASDQNQGWAPPRPTPEFPSPAPVAETDTSVGDKKQEFVESMRQQLSKTREESPIAVAPQSLADIQNKWKNTIPAPVAPAPSVVDIYRENPTVSEVQTVEPPIPPSPIHEQIPEVIPTTETVAPTETLPEEVVMAQPEEDATTSLMTPEVTEGLAQLLAEWKGVFDRGGIFGLGAHGIDHPLYKKLAPISVAEVVAGRWEGGDQTITNNIREYIDGWRRQWAIDADPEETFETYLRRVIAEILRRGVREEVAQPIAA